GLAVVSTTSSFASAVIALTALVVSIAAFYSVETGLMALIFVASTDGFLKGISPGWYTQVLKDYLLALCLLRWGWMSALGYRRESVHQPVVMPIIMFVMWCAMQMFNTTTHSVLLALAGLRAWIIWTAVFFVAYDHIRTRAQLERMLLYITFLLIPIAVYTVVQYNIGYDHLYRLGPGFRSYAKAGYYTDDFQVEMRPAATMISPHNNAAAMSCGLLMALGGFWFFRRHKLWQVATIAALPLEGVAMLLTAARAAFASTVIAAAVLLVLVRRTGVAVVMGLVVMIAVTQVDRLTGGHAMERLTGVVTRFDESVNRAWTPWHTAMLYARDHPLGSGVATGHAAGRVLWGEFKGKSGLAERIPWAENEWGRALIELGIPGLMLFAWMIFSVLKSMYRIHSQLKTREYRWLAAGLLAACIGVIARLAVGAALYTWPEAILFWIYVAGCLRLPQMEAEELSRAEPAAETEPAVAERHRPTTAAVR
ncbi:MAG: O-antigen ligase family protein, partial [Armatimonadetes bacterium]|nr:O-antigen ligase family protein [Armatimonadota bacterium]